MEVFNPQTGEVIMNDSIECIHTAVYDVNLDALNESEELMRSVLEVRSTENLKSINLSVDEKIKAFNSWVAGIAEAGVNAFYIQSEFEKYARLTFPISNRLIRFIARNDVNVMLKYISEIERKCVFEGAAHKPCLIANLENIMRSLDLDEIFLHPNNYMILKAIIRMDPPPPKELFDDRVLGMALSYPIAAELPYFKELFFDESEEIRKNVAANPSAYIFKEYRKFLSFKTEPNAKVRGNAAYNPNAVSLEEYKNFFSAKTEPNVHVRMRCAINEVAARHIFYPNFLNYKTEESVEVRCFAAVNKRATKRKEFKNFLSYKTEPSIDVRRLAAQNSQAVNLPEYVNFLSHKTEPSKLVREEAARNIRAVKFREFKNLLNEDTEPSIEVRIIAQETLKKYREKKKSHGN
ncbi:MAG: hypothetical protein ACTSU2_06075 [Promethearchaeota archaeon]